MATSTPHFLIFKALVKRSNGGANFDILLGNTVASKQQSFPSGYPTKSYVCLTALKGVRKFHFRPTERDTLALVYGERPSELKG